VKSRRAPRCTVIDATSCRTIYCTGAWPSGGFLNERYTATPGERIVGRTDDGYIDPARVDSSGWSHDG
jgi:hypothetical protein